MPSTNRFRLAALSLFLVLSSGCIPGVRVHKDPGPGDRGIRYYRPKPYLLITPIESETTVRSRPVEERTAISTSGEFVHLELQYLPDFSEEYSICVTPGFGTADVEVALRDGWNLTSINQSLDSQVDENVSAIADVADAAGGLRRASGSAAAYGQPQRRWVIRASNVPLGYYESSVNRGSDGRKRLYGWRYVGFVPYAPCPLTVCGETNVPCECAIFGLVFEEGVMTFRPLNQVHADHCHVPVATGTSQPIGQDAPLRVSESMGNSETNAAAPLFDSPPAVVPEHRFPDPR
jgi:hypothetical protein